MALLFSLFLLSVNLTGFFTERANVDENFHHYPIAPDDQLPFINDMLLLARYVSSMGLSKIKLAQSQKDRSLYSG